MSRATAIATVMSVCLVAGGSACGRKTAVRPPDLVAPETARDFAAADTDNGIELRWRRPTRYVDTTQMLDLAGFRIERRRACCGFREIHDIELDDRQRFRQAKSFTWVDEAVEPGEIYFYQIIAYTVDDYRSAPAGPVQVRRGVPLGDQVPTAESPAAP